MKNLVYLTCFFSLIGCSNHTSVTFINESEQKIDSVKIYSYKECPNLLFTDVKPGEQKKGNLIFCNKMTGDGSYGIEIYSNGKKIQEKGFGYFSNGKSLNDNFVITIGRLESILINEN